MANFRPICDVWLLARPRVRYYGAYLSGFLERARALLGVQRNDPVLHVCGGRSRDYPFAGFGPNDKTLDLDPALSPDFLMDAREIGRDQTENAFARPFYSGGLDGEWPACLIDRPYSAEDATHYVPGADALPEPNDLLRRCLSIVRPGGRVGMIDYVLPRPPKGAKFVACVGVIAGYGNRMRVYSVFERDASTPEERKRALDAVRGKTVAPLLNSETDDPGQMTWPKEDAA